MGHPVLRGHVLVSRAVSSGGRLMWRTRVCRMLMWCGVTSACRLMRHTMMPSGLLWRRRAIWQWHVGRRRMGRMRCRKHWYCDERRERQYARTQAAPQISSRVTTRAELDLHATQFLCTAISKIAS